MAKPSPSHSGDPVLIAIGDTVRHVRLDLGMSQEALALEAGLDRSYVGGIERGEHNFTISSLVKLAEALSVKPSDLLISSNY